MDIKIHCACGQNISFDVEPENGAMPCPLACPACQADVTPLANQQIQQQLTPAPATAPSTGGFKLRVAAPAAHAPAAAAGTETPSQPTPPPAPTPSGRPRASQPPPPPPSEGDGEASAGTLLLGTVGIFGGTLVGLLVWLLIANIGLHLKVVAVVVGAGAGLGARVFCREGDKSLGGIAALIAVIGMFMGGPMILDQRLRIKDDTMREVFDLAVQEAKDTVAKVPNGTDAEIIKYLSEDDGGATEVTADDIKEFREVDLKEARDLASGKTTFQAFTADVRKMESEIKKEMSGTIAGAGALRLLSVWLIGLVAGTAYKIASG